MQGRGQICSKAMHSAGTGAGETDQDCRGSLHSEEAPGPEQHNYLQLRGVSQQVGRAKNPCGGWVGGWASIIQEIYGQQNSNPPLHSTAPPPPPKKTDWQITESPATTRRSEQGPSSMWEAEY